jgi:hypothetical protein
MQTLWPLMHHCTMTDRAAQRQDHLVGQPHGYGLLARP